MADFLQGGELRVVAHGDGGRSPGRSGAAEELVGSRDYSVVFNNCEHFATYRKTGSEEPGAQGGQSRGNGPVVGVACGAGGGPTQAAGGR